MHGTKLQVDQIYNSPYNDVSLTITIVQSNQISIKKTLLQLKGKTITHVPLLGLLAMIEFIIFSPVCVFDLKSL
jgi:hypothetical protein